MQMTSLRNDVSSVLVRHSSPGNRASGHPVTSRSSGAARVSGSGAYGPQMAAYLGLEDEPAFRVTTRQKRMLAVTRLRSGSALPARSRPTPPEKAFIVELHLHNVFPASLWYRGVPVNVDRNRQAGSVCVVNLEDEPSLHSGSAFDTLQFYVPHVSLRDFADENGARRCETLNWSFGKVDPILMSLGNGILQAMESPVLSDSLYLDHALSAVHAYIACTYGGVKIEPNALRGGLARWQMQRATEILRANLEGHVSLSHVARDCKLSVSHFVRAFKRSFGQTPYRWLMERRIEAAKDLLSNSHLPQAEIALRCGFADQACFIRSFRCKVNSTPGEWRRSLGE